MNWETYIAFGDSITIGARSYLGYPEYAGNLLTTATGKNWNVINHATSGFTVIDLVRSIDKNFKNLQDSKPSVCTLLIGTNDIKTSTDLNDFEIAYRLLLVKIRLIVPAAAIKIFSIPTFPNGVMYPYLVEMNQIIPEYNKVIRKIADETGLKYYPLDFEANDLFDGVHLNNKGSKKTAEYISQLILKDRGL
jgi:lysophospholipase L1-like esterase